MKKLNRFLLVFLVCLLLPLHCFSESLSGNEVVVPMEQWQRLKQNLETLKQNSMKSEELNQKEKELNLKEQTLNQKEKELTEKMQTSLTNVNQSLNQSKDEILQDKITVGIVSFSIGAVVGAGVLLVSLTN